MFLKAFLEVFIEVLLEVLSAVFVSMFFDVGVSMISQQSAIAARRFIPCIICAVLAKSGTRGKPLREAFASVVRFTTHVRVTGFSGKTPMSSSGCTRHDTPSNLM